MKRIFATVLCTLAWIGAPAAQQPTVTVVQPGAATQIVTTGQSANDTRDELMRVLELYPPTLRRLIATDPALMTNAQFMQPYPQLAGFLTQHPDVERNPAYYFGSVSEIDSDPARQAWEMWEDLLTGGMVFFIVASVAAFLGWLLKTFMDHRRWLHVTRVQTEAHNKLLDRLAGHEELLAYIQSPSGRRFLDAAPTLEPEPKSVGAPVSRVLWSVQIGAVLLFAGMALFVAARNIAAVSAPLLLVALLALGMGVGFMVSAVAAYGLSRRFGLLNERTNA
jgi:hypothetical protein